METQNSVNSTAPQSIPEQTLPRLLRKPDVLSMTGIGSHTTLYDMIRRGDFPLPVKLNSRSSAWREDEVVAWINNRPRAEIRVETRA